MKNVTEKTDKPKLEVICITMGQKDFGKVEEMNIQTSALFANQADRYSYEEFCRDSQKIRMVTTMTRGVGKNRNIALMHAEGDILLLADDDVRYVDNYEEIVQEAYRRLPNADLIVFNLITENTEKIRQIKQIKKCNRFTLRLYGGARFSVKREAVYQSNMWFSLLFGGGSRYPSGEDSKWLLDFIRAGKNVYLYPEVIGTVSFDKSTWFTGYDKSYFFGKGAFYAAVHPISKYVWMIYFIIRTIKLGEISLVKRVRMIMLGMEAYKKGRSFEEMERECLSKDK